MIYKLRRKFIKIASISILLVFLFTFVAIYFIGYIKTVNMIDILADIVSENDGKFPDFENFEMGNIEGRRSMPNFINRETPFTTRFFTVHFDENKEVLNINTMSISNVSHEEAKEYALSVYDSGKERGWYLDYRYKVYDTENGSAVIFVDGSLFKSTSDTSLVTVTSVFFACSFAVLVLIIFFSKRAVKPIAESYEKQKQFVSDANHELKTPLTLILTNIDIAESELGENEWLDDMRVEGNRMSTLINELGILAKMDEESFVREKSKFSLSDAVTDTVYAFRNIADEKEISFDVEIDSSIEYYGIEEEIRRLISVLTDNAVKYCDKNGSISIRLSANKHPVFSISNSCSEIDTLELDKLFNRFYRADKSRTFGGGFGIGLSIAKSIAENHHAELSVNKCDDSIICFKLVM